MFFFFKTSILYDKFEISDSYTLRIGLSFLGCKALNFKLAVPTILTQALRFYCLYCKFKYMLEVPFCVYNNLHCKYI